MLKTLLISLSVLSVFASDAQYTSTPIAAQPTAQYGNGVVYGQTMPTTQSFQSTSTYSVPNSYINATNTLFGEYSLAEVQNFYSVVSEETLPAKQPFAPSVRRSPGVPKRAPIGDGVGALLICSALYLLYLFGRRYAKSHRPQSRRR